MTAPAFVRLPNYFAPVLRLAKLGTFPPGTMTRVDIYHDDWCAVWHDGVACDCAPDVRVVRVDDKRHT